jgi:hypothetical protein
MSLGLTCRFSRRASVVCAALLISSVVALQPVKADGITMQVDAVGRGPGPVLGGPSVSETITGTFQF